MSIMPDKFSWLTVLVLIGTHMTLMPILREYRDDNRVLKMRGT